MLTYSSFFANSPNLTLDYAQWIEELLDHIVFVLKVFLESIAVLIIAVAAVRTLLRLLQHFELIRHQQNWEIIRLDLGLSLALSLEFLLAADIVATAISPSWDALGKLGVVTGIRIVLNIFLEKEVNQLEAKNHHLNRKAVREKKIYQ